LCAFANAQTDDSSEELGGLALEFTPCLQWTDSEISSQQYYIMPQNIPSDKEIKQFIDSFKPVFSYLSKKISEIVSSSSLGYVTSRVKTVASVAGKLQRYPNTKLDELKDIVGFRITSRTVDAVLKVMSLIESQSDLTILEKKCYGICPGVPPYRSTDGYRRVHYILSVLNKSAELQLGTPYMTMFADWGHDMIYKGPSDIKNNPSAIGYSLNVAIYFYTLDCVRGDMRCSKIEMMGLPICPQILQTADVLKILSSTDNLGPIKGPQQYKNIGSPPNGCFLVE